MKFQENATSLSEYTIANNEIFFLTIELIVYKKNVSKLQLHQYIYKNDTGRRLR